MADSRLFSYEGLRVSPAVRREISRHPPLGEDVERTLLLAAQSGDSAARQKLITHNLAYVAKVGGAYRTEQPGPLLDDEVLFQQGILGLSQAIDKWSPDGGANLRTFAYWHVRKAMQSDDGLYSNETIRLPECARQPLKRIHQTLDEGCSKPEDIAERVGCGVNKVQRLLSVHQPSSLNNPAAADEQAEWIDLVQDPAEPSDNQTLEESIPLWANELSLDQILSKISSVLADVIRLRFIEGMTYKALAEKFSVSLGKVKKMVKDGLAALHSVLLQAREPDSSPQSPQSPVNKCGNSNKPVKPPIWMQFTLCRFVKDIHKLGSQVIQRVKAGLKPVTARSSLNSPQPTPLSVHQIRNNIIPFRCTPVQGIVYPKIHSQKEFDSGGFLMIRDLAIFFFGILFASLMHGTGIIDVSRWGRIINQEEVGDIAEDVGKAGKKEFQKFKEKLKQ